VPTARGIAPLAVLRERASSACITAFSLVRTPTRILSGSSRRGSSDAGKKRELKPPPIHLRPYNLATGARFFAGRLCQGSRPPDSNQHTALHSTIIVAWVRIRSFASQFSCFTASAHLAHQQQLRTSMGYPRAQSTLVPNIISIECHDRSMVPAPGITKHPVSPTLT
jgi:hypothetical protein